MEGNHNNSILCESVTKLLQKEKNIRLQVEKREGTGGLSMKVTSFCGKSFSEKNFVCPKTEAVQISVNRKTVFEKGRRRFSGCFYCVLQTELQGNA